MNAPLDDTVPRPRDGPCRGCWWCPPPSAAALDRPQEAVALFERASKTNPHTFDRWHALVRVHAPRGDWQHCNDAESRALRLKPPDVEARQQRSEALARTDKPAEARAELDTLAGIDPTLQPALDASFQRLPQDLRPAR